jgi:hypothetical protein
MAEVRGARACLNETDKASFDAKLKQLEDDSVEAEEKEQLEAEVQALLDRGRSARSSAPLPPGPAPQRDASG